MVKSRLDNVKTGSLEASGARSCDTKITRFLLSFNITAYTIIDFLKLVVKRNLFVDGFI